MSTSTTSGSALAADRTFVPQPAACRSVITKMRRSGRREVARMRARPAQGLREVGGAGGGPGRLSSACSSRVRSSDSSPTRGSLPSEASSSATSASVGNSLQQRPRPVLGPLEQGVAVA